MSEFYELTSGVTEGKPPLTLDEAKKVLHVTSKLQDDTISLLVRAALSHGEDYTGRDFRPQSWTVLLDGFDARMCLFRSPIAAITSVEYLLATVLTAVPSTVWYLKNSVSFSEIILRTDQVWPSDADDIEHNVKIIFTTTAVREIDVVKLAMHRHIAFMFENRGDVDVNLPNQIVEAARACGADSLYDQLKIPRF